MKYFLIFLLALGVFMILQTPAHASVSFDRTIYPVMDPDPLELWNSADVIIDGTIVEVENKTTDEDLNIQFYHIKVNKYFKGISKIDLLYAKNEFVLRFDPGDNGLFYLKSDNSFGYVIQSHSVKTYDGCDARSMIEISPTLPNEGFPRSAPTRSESYFDSCIADYFTYDPDFFRGIHNGISPLKQIKHGIPNEIVRCYNGLILVQKYDGSPACVKSETKIKLMEREWMPRPMSDAQQIIERLRQGPQLVDEVDAKYIETLALMDKTVTNFVSGTDWKSNCCGYSVNDDVYELTITFLDIKNQRQIGVTFDLDTMGIIDIENDRAVKLGGPGT
ncbi:MAG: hypothetical protein ACW9W4_01110 [Candidatus Nitrosopumilus sp. bin_7KS]